jgi:hypothetical protein
VLGSEGEVLGELPVEGRGIKEGGAVTGIFADGDSVYAEREHGQLIRLGDTSGQPDPTQPEVPGRPSRDGRSYLLAGIIHAQQGILFLAVADRATGENRFTREYQLGESVTALLGLDSNLQGTIYFALQAAEGALLLCAEPEQGQLLGEVSLPENNLPEESMRELVALDQGGVVFAVRTEQGVSYQAFSCP